jgi:Caspase domain
VLALLTGKQPEKDLSAAVPDSRLLRRATPDDLLILTIASHGYADAQGVFYFFPQDSGANYKDGLAAVLPHTVSSDELMLWLRDLDAGEIVLIVDACHSAATVEGEGFKPGPLGSRGLGQLSYDKGMRILAATQADNVALESGDLEHGLLTAALIQDGLVGMQADSEPKDGTIRVSKWLKFAVRRVPELYQQAARGSRDLVVHDPAGASAGSRDTALQILKTEPQTPAFFDFARSQRDALLAKSSPRPAPHSSAECKSCSRRPTGFDF